MEKFRKPPIGPLGIEIQVKENVSKKHVEIIETELGKLLTAFLVDNFEDKRLLDRIAKTVGMTLTIITSKYLRICLVSVRQKEAKTEVRVYQYLN